MAHALAQMTAPDDVAKSYARARKPSAWPVLKNGAAPGSISAPSSSVRASLVDKVVVETWRQMQTLEGAGDWLFEELGQQGHRFRVGQFRLLAEREDESGIIVVAIRLSYQYFTFCRG
jgi:hypothetical protein